MQSQGERARYWLWVAVLAVAALLTILAFRRFRRAAEPVGPVPETFTAKSSNSIPAALTNAARPGPSDELYQKLLATGASLKAAQNTPVLQRQLAELRQTLSAAGRQQASDVIRRFLEAGTDAPTGSGFELGGGGSLVNSPSLRVFLLDLLAEIDPQAAVAYSRRILENPGSPDEWAIALRNVARLDSAPGTREFLEQKTEAMLRQDPWVNGPSTGFLEAFDVAVHLGGTRLLPPLTDLVQRKDNPAVAHAAFLALDRMVIRQPAELMEVLEQHPEMMAGREQTRANYFARADVGDPVQREILERYLLDPKRQAPELQSFAGVFPNANFMISHNLLTSNVTPGGATLARRDRDALRVVGEWLADPRFVSLRAPLLTIQQRLQEFSRQAKSNR